MKIQGYHISYQISLFLLLLLTFSSLYAYPVNSIPTTNDADQPHIVVTIPGTLQQLVDESGASLATSLKVSGKLNGADILTLRRLAGRDEKNGNTGGVLTALDIEGVSFVTSDDVYFQREIDGVLNTYCITDPNEIPENAFRYTKLHRIVLPSSLTTVGSMAFYACYSLDEVVFSEHITAVGSSAFRNTGLREVTVPAHVTIIGPWAFGENSQLTNVHLGQNVCSIGYSAFNRCDAIEEVTSDISQPFYIQGNVFSETTFTNAKLRVPAGTAPLYRRTKYWRSFQHIEEQGGAPLPLPYMVMASWHQGEPFNNDCPQDGSDACKAGCGTIAMAQILSYYRQPAKGHGRATYHYDFNGTSNDIDEDLDSHPFDWANIRDVYSESSNDAERRAVANLVYMTGTAMKMQYSPSASSTVNYGTWMWGLQRYMHLSPSSRWFHRKYYSTAEWTALIDGQLDTGHPVFYNAAHTEPFGEKSGHFFVIDGRDQQGRYHFNFGHDNSTQDKFTDLNAINQASEPKPGNVFACYHYEQGMIVDGYPVEGSDVYSFQRCDASLSKPFVLEDAPQAREMTVSGRVRAKFQYRCISFNADVIQYTLGFYRNGQLVAVSPSWRENNISIGGGVSNVDRHFLLPDDLADGDYEMALVTRDGESSPWQRGWDNAPNSIAVSVSGESFTFRLPDYHNGQTSLYLKDAVQEISDDREDGRTFEFSICNPSTNNFVDTLRVDIVADGQVYDYYMPTAVYDGQVLSYRYFIPDDKAGFCDDYTIRLYYHDTPTGEWLPLQDVPLAIECSVTKSFGDSYVVYTIGGVAVRKQSHNEDRGNLLSGLPQGIYIIRSADGTTRKVFVR